MKRKPWACISLALAGLLCAGTATARPPYAPDTSKPFNQYTWVTAHNAYNNQADYYRFPTSQGYSIAQQLDAGVRGLMLDVHDSNGRVRLCHGSCNGSEKTLAEYLSGDILPFLSKDRSAVITITLEDYVSKASLQREFALVPSLADVTFSPDAWPGERWPTLQEMIDANQRLLLLAENSADGTYIVDSGTVQVIGHEALIVETYWSLGTTIFTHDYSCVSRFKTPLTRSTVDLPGKAWQPLFTMNHFHGAAETLHSRTDNRYDKLQDRYDNHCGPASDRPRPNFVAIDFVHQGDPFQFAGIKTNGGLVLYEDNHLGGDVVCGIPAAPTRQLRFATEGCENDEARSGRLEHVKAGTIFRLYDSPSGSTSDDYTLIKVFRDIVRADIPTFESDVDSLDYRLEFHRKNGLDGKISRVEVVAP